MAMAMTMSWPCLKISGESITKPPQIIFKSCFENDICCNEWKELNIVPVSKNKQQAINKKLQTFFVTSNL